MLSTHFIRRGYPKHLVLTSLKRCLEQNRDELLNKELMKKEKRNRSSTNTHDTFYCITTHNPLNPNFKTIVKQNGELLQKTKTTLHLQDAKLIFGLRRNKNLSDQLVRASTRTEIKPSHSEANPCKRPSTCRYCPALNKSGHITSNITGKRFDHSAMRIGQI